MTHRRIALIIHGQRTNDADQALLPNNSFCPETEAALDELWLNGQLLIKQCDELTALIPANAAKHVEQREAEMFKLAVAYAAKLEAVK